MRPNPSWFLCVHLPHWPIARCLRRRRDLRRKPIVVVQRTHQRLSTVDASDEAIAAGIRLGMSLTEARALCVGVVTIPHEPEADMRALEALGRWMTRFTPSVATGWPRSKDEPAAGSHVLLLDLTGCERLFGGLRAIVTRVRQALTRFGLAARLAMAPTPSAAWAFARAATNAPIIDAATLRPAVARLSIDVLRLESGIIDSLREVGVCTIGQLMALPRDALPARFGGILLERLDQLLGVRPDPLVALSYEPPIAARMRFDAPVESLESLWLVLEQLVACISADLRRRGHGARELNITCMPDRYARQGVVRRSVKLSRPSRNPKELLDLLKCAVERLNCGDGFVEVQLRVTDHGRLSDEQIDLLDNTDGSADRLEVDRLMERSSARLGESAVLRPVLRASYLPERSWDAVPALKPAERQVVAPRSRPRPLQLLPTPLEVMVLAEPSDDREGRPFQFAAQGASIGSCMYSVLSGSPANGGVGT
ncbi:MAG: DNA polymerase Y family protein [Tepidisphaeraceae bacterium]